MNTHKNADIHIVNGALFLAIGTTLSTVLKFLTIPILSRLLDPEAFGKVNVCLSFIALLACIGGSGGWSSAVVVFNREDKNAWQNAFSANIIISSIICVLIVLFSFQICQILSLSGFENYVAVISLLMPLSFINDTLSTYQISRGNSKIDAINGIVSDVVASIVALYLAFKGYGAWSLIWQQLISAAIRAALSMYFSRLLPVLKLNLSLLKSYASFTIKSSSAEIINYFGVQFPNIIINKMINASSAGVFSVTNRISALPHDIISNSLSKILLNAFSSKKTEVQKADNLLWAAFANSFIVTPALFGAAAVAEPLVEVLLGEKFKGAGIIFALLCIGKAIITPTFSFYSFLKSENRAGSLSNLMLVRSVFIVLFLVIGIKINGIVGAAYGFAISMVPTFIHYTLYVCKIANISVFKFLKHISPIFISSILMFVFVAMTDRYFELMGFSPIIRLAIGFLLDLIFFISMIAFLLIMIKHKDNGKRTYKEIIKSTLNKSF